MFNRTRTLIDLTPVFLNDRSNADEIFDALTTNIVDGVCLPVYRTEQLVSRIHDNEQASAYKSNELNQDQTKQWAERIRENGFKLAVTPLDRTRIPWMNDEISPDYFITHSGDLTFKRLHQDLTEQDTPVIVRTELAPDPEVVRTLSWYSHSDMTILRGIPSDLTFPRRLAPLDQLESPDSEDVKSGLSYYGHEFEQLKQSELEPEILLIGPELERLNSFTETIENLNDPNPTETDEKPNNGTLDTDDLEDRLIQYRRRYRRSLMPEQSIAAGSTLSKEDIRELRPGEGLPAEKIDQCDGMLVPRPTDPQEIISYS